MKQTLYLLFCLFSAVSAIAGSVEKTFYFSQYQIRNFGTYQAVTFPETKLSGLPGEPVLPYHEVSLILPLGEIATAMEVVRENEVLIPGSFELYPQQNVRPISFGNDGKFIKKEIIYQLSGPYPGSPAGHLLTQYLNGFAFALSTFTPLVYHPSSGSVSYYSKITVKVTTRPDPQAKHTLGLLTASEAALKRVRSLAQNPEMMERYPKKTAGPDDYKLLVITPLFFQDYYADLLDYYNSKGIQSQVQTTEFIDNNMVGHDLQQKIRNYIKQEYSTKNIEYVLLGGDIQLVPYRGFYCYAISQPDQEDYNIPADLYFSALDGEWNDSTLVGGDINKWGEPGEDDLLPEVSVARFPFNTATELQNMVHKSLYYQKYPVLGEFNQPYLLGEYLYENPITFGGDYMELLVDDHNDNGYFTHGIPGADNDITRLYDTLISPGNIYTWGPGDVIGGINEGKSFIHHLGHSNVDYMLKMSIWLVNDQNFSQVDGVTHNYALLYTQGCLCGAFDNQTICIAEQAVTIQNFLAAGIFNSRYGWFDQGLTEGPSEHLHREFVSALYNDTVENQIKEIGAAHLMSKIKTAPWIGLPGEFEPGAQRWVHYCCNVLGDPALKIWTNDPTSGIPESSGKLAFSVYPNPCKNHFELNFSLPGASDVHLTLINTMGQTVFSTLYPSQNRGNHTLTLSLPSIEGGVYLCRLEAGTDCGVKKIIIIQ